MIVPASINEYIKSQTLLQKWNMRKQNPFMAKGNSPFITNRNQVSEQEDRSVRMEPIMNKLRTGQKLGLEDMEYLRTHAPDLYRKALAIETEREEYQRQLTRCRSKEEVEELHTGKMRQFLSEISAVERSGLSGDAKQAALEFIGWRIAAINYEHKSFVSTPEYARLPERRKDEDNTSKPALTYKKQLELMLKPETPNIERPHFDGEVPEPEGTAAAVKETAIPDPDTAADETGAPDPPGTPVVPGPTTYTPAGEKAVAPAESGFSIVA